jgi:hypothetical protein
MKIWTIPLIFLLLPLPGLATDNPMAKQNGIVSLRSDRSVDATVDRLKDILQSKGVTLFALIDHSGEAEKVGMKMPPTKLLIFGSPKAGTPLMLASPSTAIDLPLKISGLGRSTEGSLGFVQRSAILKGAARTTS